MIEMINGYKMSLRTNHTLTDRFTIALILITLFICSCLWIMSENKQLELAIRNPSSTLQSNANQASLRNKRICNIVPSISTDDCNYLRSARNKRLNGVLLTKPFYGRNMNWMICVMHSACLAIALQVPLYIDKEWRNAIANLIDFHHLKFKLIQFNSSLSFDLISKDDVDNINEYWVLDGYKSFNKVGFPSLFAKDDVDIWTWIAFYHLYRPPKKNLVDAKDIIKKYNDSNSVLVSIHRRHLEGECDHRIKKSTERYSLINIIEYLKGCNYTFSNIFEQLKKYEGIDILDKNISLIISSDGQDQAGDTALVNEAVKNGVKLLEKPNNFITELALMSMTDIHFANIGSSIDLIIYCLRATFGLKSAFPEVYFLKTQCLSTPLNQIICP